MSAFGNSPLVLGGNSLSVPSGSIPVGGPGSSTDNAIVRWDGTGGNLVQNSVLIVADTTGALSGFGAGAGLTFSGGGTVVGTSGSLDLTASGTNQNITLTPSGTGIVAVNAGAAATSLPGVLRLANISDTIAAGGELGRVDFFSGDDSGGGNAVATKIVAFQPATTPVTGALDFFVGSAAATRALRITDTGIGLWGTTTDSSNGRIQLATHTTSAGGIGFGADVSLFRHANTGLDMTATGAVVATFKVTQSAGRQALIQVDGSNAYIDSGTAGAGMVFRTNGSTTALTLDSSQGATFAGPIYGAVQALSGAGAVNVTQLHTSYTSTGVAQALTLANGTSGQIKTITHTVDGGSGVLTPTTALGYTTITFTLAGDSVTLRYTSAGWAIIGIYGAVAA